MHLRVSLIVAVFLTGTASSVFAQENKANIKQADQGKSAAPTNRRSRQYPPQLEGANVQVYKTIGDVKLNMYVFQPKDGGSKKLRPAIVFFFGGGWRGGTPAQFYEQAKYFASRGMVALVADYRVSSRHGTKAIHCVADAKSAIRWVRQHAEDLGVDSNRIVAAGGSAGGHIAACTGVVAGMEEEGENIEISSQPNAMVLFNPALVLADVDGKNILGDRAKTMQERVGDEPEKISPLHHIERDLPPTIIFFGTDDSLLKRAEYYVAAAKQANNRCELLTWEGLPHGFFNYGRYKNKPYIETVRAADKFLASLGYLEGEPTLEIPE